MKHPRPGEGEATQSATEQSAIETTAFDHDERLRELLAAVISITEERTLDTVLRRIVQAGCQLLDAQYGALGVIGHGNDLSHFVTEGMDPNLAKLIGPLPTGNGVLGLLIREPRPIRLPNLQDHPASSGFPKHHPPMRTFLGVPIRARDSVFGNLYLTEKRGARLFTAEDESLAVALAGAAGFAIENAKLFDEAKLRTDWLEAGKRVAVGMMGAVGDGARPDAKFVAHMALDPSESTMVLVASPPNEEGQLEVTGAAGTRAAELTGRFLNLDREAVERVVASGSPTSFENASTLLGPAFARETGPALLARLGTDGAAHGLMILIRAQGQDLYSPLTAELIASYCAQSVLALELAQTHRLREQLMLYTDRDRIAQDLHDVVIQRLFAAGLNVQSLARFITDAPGLARIRTITDELDATIKELRDTIYSLRATAGETDLLGSRIVNTVQKVSKTLPFAPRIVLSGPIDSQVSTDLAEHVLAVVTEGVSNAVRHAQAQKIDVNVTAGLGLVSVTVRDDGCGIASSNGRSGLANMEARAANLKGVFQLESVVGQGTSFYWSVPLDQTVSSLVL
ncbi:GAF domain-containing sensor histidine kinase [Arthrobacter sp. E3]|uniref:GAF domain-containing sensor histidine kinase n=1 Tax=Arthrobacter sp. E3 TaxID=517402 RepID=UPI001A93DD1F|nr:GAF domain-containing sensor histidine kinase [Arthrobacter sp. E3]